MKLANTVMLLAVFTIAVAMIGITQVSCASPTERTQALQEEKLKQDDTSSEIPTVELCEVLKKPFLYQSKVIRIDGNLGRFQDYITFYDEDCVPKHPLINVEFDSSFQSDFKGEASAKLDQIVRGSKEARDGNVKVFVSSIGLFESIPTNETRDFTELQYRFSIRKILEVAP